MDLGWMLLVYVQTILAATEQLADWLMPSAGRCGQWVWSVCVVNGWIWLLVYVLTILAATEQLAGWLMPSAGRCGLIVRN